MTRMRFFALIRLREKPSPLSFKRRFHLTNGLASVVRKENHRTDGIHSISYNKLYPSFLLYWAFVREASIKFYLSYEFFSYDRYDDMKTRLKRPRKQTNKTKTKTKTNKQRKREMRSFWSRILRFSFGTWRGSRGTKSPSFVSVFCNIVMWSGPIHGEQLREVPQWQFTYMNLHPILCIRFLAWKEEWIHYIN